MKKFLLISLLLLNPTFSRANEVINVKLGNDYLIMTERTVQTYNVTDTNILTLSPFFTLFNERNSILLHPEAKGQTDITIILEKGFARFSVNVSDKKSSIDDKPKQLGDFEIMLLDTPPAIQNFDIDAPPVQKESK